MIVIFSTKSLNCPCFAEKLAVNLWKTGNQIFTFRQVIGLYTQLKLTRNNVDNKIKKWGVGGTCRCGCRESDLHIEQIVLCTYRDPIWKATLKYQCAK